MTDIDLSRTNFALDAHTMSLPIVEDHGMDVIEGSGEVRAQSLSVDRSKGIERGVWEVAEGIVEDTETDELAVILSGEGTIEFLNTDNESVELRPGTFLILKAGSRTRWTIRRRLRKVYQIPWSDG